MKKVYIIITIVLTVLHLTSCLKQEETITILDTNTDTIIEEQEEEEKEEIDEINLETMTKILIASGETNFNPNQKERSNNIRLAASYIDGLILRPGDEFSFNNVVGKRTKERGFLLADIFVGQSTAKGYGGGVCQTSSTVCTTVRKTEMVLVFDV